MGLRKLRRRAPLRGEDLRQREVPGPAAERDDGEPFCWPKFIRWLAEAHQGGKVKTKNRKNR